MTFRTPRSHVAIALGAVAVLTLVAACGTRSRTISESDELAALRTAGFSVHQVAPDAVATGDHVPFVELLAVRFATADRASRTYETGYSSTTLRQQLEQARTNPLYKGVLPKHFKDSMIETKLVCNVILTSYSSMPDTLLHARFKRAAVLLGHRCK